MEEFQATVQYFGEDSKKVTTTELFGVFADFITKFEVHLLQDLLKSLLEWKKKHFVHML